MGDKSYTVRSHDPSDAILLANATFEAAREVPEWLAGKATIFDDSDGRPACMLSVDPACECRRCAPEEGDIVLLPGGLLGRIVILDDGDAVVDRWSSAEPSGWREFGTTTLPLPEGDERKHHNYAAAFERREEPAK